MTKGHKVNALAVERLRSSFGRSNTWQLPADDDDHVEGRALGWPDAATIEQRIAAGARIRGTRVSEQFTFDDYRERNPGATLPALIRSGDLVLPSNGPPLNPPAPALILPLPSYRPPPPPPSLPALPPGHTAHP